MTTFQNYQSALAAAVDADPVLRLAHAAAWLDPLRGILDDDDLDAAMYGDDPDAAITTALFVTRRNFPDVYLDTLDALRTGQSYQAIDTLVCTAFNQKGIPLDSLEWLGWGVPLPAYGVELDDPDFWTSHPDAAPVLACFGVSPEPNPYRIEVPDMTYGVAQIIENDLREQFDPTWQQVAELVSWLFGTNGNSSVLCGIESPLSNTSRTSHTVAIPDHAYRVAELLAVNLEAHTDIRYRQMAWLLRWLFSNTNNSCLDWDDETMCSVEPLSWEPDDVAFAVEIIAEAETIMADIQSTLKWIQENPVVLVGLALNVAQLYQALEKRPQQPPRLTYHWFDPDHESLDEVLGRIGISAGKIKVTSRSSADPN